MPKFTFIAEHESGQKVTYECEHDFIDHVLEDFDLFLRGAGFFPQGDRLEYISDEYESPEWQTPEWETPQEEPHEWTQTLRNDNEFPFPPAGAGSNVEFGGAGNLHSKHYFDTERNR